MIIPEYIQKIISTLEKNNYEAFIVGGCVRDSLLNKEPYDYDITTNALPEEILECFSDARTITNGLKHGTVTVVTEKGNVEITTYRIDGSYVDNRHPDNVCFTRSLKEDLARRDFTINAIAYSDKTGIVDMYGGIADLNSGIIRCVGDANKRFNEDALRIMRALRFASTLGFSIEENTALAIHNNKQLLDNISIERNRDELLKLICGDNAKAILLEYGEVIAQIIPEIKREIGFNQHSVYHAYDVWEHTVQALSKSSNNVDIRLALLLHDIAKPVVFKQDPDGTGHFPNHENVGSVIAIDIMKRLKIDNKRINELGLLIKYHGYFIKSDKPYIKKMLNKLGEDTFFKLLEIMVCDNSAKNEFCLERVPRINEMGVVAKEIIANNEPYKLSHLDINGDDLKKAGVHGKNIGDALNELLKLVVTEEVPNNKQALLDAVKIIQD